jgi:hypothetical protein
VSSVPQAPSRGLRRSFAVESRGFTMLRVPSTKWHFFLCLLVKKEDVLFGRFEFSAILKSMVLKLYVRMMVIIHL